MGIKRYTVVSGDYLYKIAKEHGTTVGIIWNHELNYDHRIKRESPEYLYPGDVLYIPVPDELIPEPPIAPPPIAPPPPEPPGLTELGTPPSVPDFNRRGFARAKTLLGAPAKVTCRMKLRFDLFTSTGNSPLERQPPFSSYEEKTRPHGQNIWCLNLWKGQHAALSTQCPSSTKLHVGNPGRGIVGPGEDGIFGTNTFEQIARKDGTSHLFFATYFESGPTSPNGAVLDTTKECSLVEDKTGRVYAQVWSHQIPPRGHSAWISLYGTVLVLSAHDVHSYNFPTVAANGPYPPRCQIVLSKAVDLATVRGVIRDFLFKHGTIDHLVINSHGVKTERKSNIRYRGRVFRVPGLMTRSTVLLVGGFTEASSAVFANDVPSESGEFHNVSAAQGAPNYLFPKSAYDKVRYVWLQGCTVGGGRLPGVISEQLNACVIASSNFTADERPVARPREMVDLAPDYGPKAWDPRTKLRPGVLRRGEFVTKTFLRARRFHRETDFADGLDFNIQLVRRHPIIK